MTARKPTRKTNKKPSIRAQAASGKWGTGFIYELGTRAQTKRHELNKSDKSRKAMPPGWRISKTGKLYYESRQNRSDTEGQIRRFAETPVKAVGKKPGKRAAGQPIKKSVKKPVKHTANNPFMAEFSKVYHAEYNKMYNNNGDTGGNDSEKFDDLIKTNPRFKKLLKDFSTYAQDVIGISDREASAFYRAYIKLGLLKTSAKKPVKITPAMRSEYVNMQKFGEIFNNLDDKFKDAKFNDSKEWDVTKYRVFEGYDLSSVAREMNDHLKDIQHYGGGNNKWGETRHGKNSEGKNVIAKSKQTVVMYK